MKIKILFIVLVFVNTVYSQEKFEVEKMNFSIEKPENWLIFENEEVLKNLEEFDFSKENLDDLIKSSANGIDLVTFLKYDPNIYVGIIPTIKIRSYKTTSKILDSLSVEVNKFLQQGKIPLDNFKIKDSLEVVKILNFNVIKFSVLFTLKRGEKKHEILSKSYYILKDGYFISTNFIEEIDKENNNVFFEALINSIAITK